MNLFSLNIKSLNAFFKLTYLTKTIFIKTRYRVLKFEKIVKYIYFLA